MKRILTTIIIIFVLVILFVLFRFKIPAYNDYYSNTVIENFNDKYGTTAEVLYVKHGIISSEVRVETSDNEIADCKCGFLGNIESDSYCNYVYAREDIKRVEAIADKYYDECHVLVNYMMTREKDNQDLETELVKSSSSTTYEKYSEAMQDANRYIWIQIPEECDESQTSELLEDLKTEFADQGNYTVLIKKYPREIYDSYCEIDIVSDYELIGSNVTGIDEDMAHQMKKEYRLNYEDYLIAYYNYDGRTELVP